MGGQDRALKLYPELDMFLAESMRREQPKWEARRKDQVCCI